MLKRYLHRLITTILFYPITESYLAKNEFVLKEEYTRRNIFFAYNARILIVCECYAWYSRLRTNYSMQLSTSRMHISTRMQTHSDVRQARRLVTFCF